MSENWIPHVVQKNYSRNHHMLKYCVSPYFFSSLYASLGMSVCNCCFFLTQYSLQQYNPHKLTAEFRSFAVPLESLLKADLKMHHMITATSINVNI